MLPILQLPGSIEAQCLSIQLLGLPVLALAVEQDGEVRHRRRDLLVLGPQRLLLDRLGRPSPRIVVSSELSGLIGSTSMASTNRYTGPSPPALQVAEALEAAPVHDEDYSRCSRILRYRFRSLIPRILAALPRWPSVACRTRAM